MKLGFVGYFYYLIYSITPVWERLHVGMGSQ